MHYLRRRAWVLVGLGLLLVMLMMPTLRADLARDPGWEYGRLTLGAGGDPVFVSGREKITIHAALERGSGNVRPANPRPDRPTFTVQQVWDADMMALNTLGDEGWEAFATAAGSDGKTTIYLRRRS